MATESKEFQRLQRLLREGPPTPEPPSPPKKPRSRAPVYNCDRHGRWLPPHPPKHDCVNCWALYGLWRHDSDQKAAVRSQGRAKGGGQSSKRKGRSACVTVQRALLAAAPWLSEQDIYVKATSQMGVDLHLSPRAREWFAYSIEAKNVELLNIWKALDQATKQAAKDGLPPIVFFKRAHSALYVALRHEDFLKLLPWPNHPLPTTAPLPSPS